MSDKALAEVMAFVLGTGVTQPDALAEIVTEQLARRGLSVQPSSAPVLQDLTPETLRRVRLALGLTRRQLAAAAELKEQTLGSAENPNRSVEPATRVAIGRALVRSGAVALIVL